MRKFLIGKTGNLILSIALSIAMFVLLNALFGLGGAIGGAIAGIVGFGAAAGIKRALSPAGEKTGDG